jgi:hypothetical protein
MPEYSQTGAAIVEPLLRIDRGNLRMASARNVASGTAVNASAGASAGSVLSGNSSPLAMPPSNATAYNGAAQPLNMTIELRTPSGPVALTSAEFVAQQHAYADLVRRLNAGHSYEVGQYIERFGLINSTQRANLPYGDGWGKDVWSGMGVLQQRYVHMQKMSGRLVHGWFLLPRPFSQAQAGLPASEDEPGSAQYYPALFAIFPNSMLYRMACLHILLVNCKPWWVHDSRVVNQSQ